jgi:A/G-specific adenine glycosylase
MPKSSQQQYFVKQLLKWNQLHNSRQMPWKGEKDPYKIWLSEIILQQTRVEQGLDYYTRFITAFPTLHHLAKAPEEQVFKLWEGLGYYTRCKNLIATAKNISKNLGGKFPVTYEHILELKGIGPYTAAAISSFAYNLPHAVVDGNVYRVLARYFGVSTAIDSIEGKKYFTALANELLDKKLPGEYNQSLMDFGATICKPQIPLCSMCLLKKNCEAFLNNTTSLYPVKEKTIIKKPRWLYYVVAEYKGSVYVRKRGQKDTWENLYEFILSEQKEAVSSSVILSQFFHNGETKKPPYIIEHISAIYKQQLTHQTIYGQFIKILLTNTIALDGYEKIKSDSLEMLPFPKFISNYIKDKSVSLNLF